MKQFLFGLLFLVAFSAHATNPVQSKSGKVSTSAVTTQTLTITMTSPVTVGDSVVVTFSFASSTGAPSITSVTDNLGNTYTQRVSANNPGISSPIAIYTALGVTNAPQTITIVIGSSVSASIAVAANIYEDTNTVLDVSAFHANTSSSTAFLASFTTTAANDSAYAVVSSNDGNETYTQNNGWTQGFNDNSNTSSFYFNIPSLTTAGANSLNMTASTAVADLWGVIALKSATPPAPSKFPFFGVGAMLVPFPGREPANDARMPIASAEFRRRAA